MRRRTRNVTLGVLMVGGLLLALGALPSLLRAGDPYYVTAQPGGDHPAVNVTDLPDGRFPYVTAALGNATADREGRSGPYWRGPVGLKEVFTHSPFDEFDALRARQPNATAGDDVYVAAAEGRFRLSIVREGAP
jgi:hypothetical protein